MRIQGIIHQQVCQLRWHLLACLGLIMVLPIEDAVVNLREGDGFHSIRLVYAAITFSPLLAGLIACANVQGDLNEKRYIFWRSNIQPLFRMQRACAQHRTFVAHRDVACRFCAGVSVHVASGLHRYI